MTIESQINAIYGATHGGLDILSMLYPAIANRKSDKEKIKVRDEKTPSASLRVYNGIYYLIDFGGDAKTHDAFDWYAADKGIDRYEAIKTLYQKYVGKPEEEEKHLFFENKKDEDVEGDCTWTTCEFNEHDLKLFGLPVKEAHLKFFGWQKVESMRRVAKDKVIIKKSTSDYPIYIRLCRTENDQKKFYKIYEPSAKEKQYRFSYYPSGVKPADYINGMWELHSQCVSEDGTIQKIPICICSGERDAMCCYAMGVAPIWLNSETAKFKGYQYQLIKSKADGLYMCPDIDETGVRQGRAHSLHYPELRIIWLPKELSNHKDWRGKPMKDLRDWVSLGNGASEFYNLRKIAKQAKFIAGTPASNGEMQYTINAVNLLYWLNLHDFGTLRLDKDSISLVRIVDGQIKEVTVTDIRSYIVERMYYDYCYIGEINTIIKSKQLNESLFNLLAPIEAVKPLCQCDDERIVFSNCTYRVTPTTIIAEDSTNEKYLSTYLIDNEFNLRSAPYRWTIDPSTMHIDIDIINHDSLYQQFATETSRIYWRDDARRLGISETEYQSTYRNNIVGLRLSPSEQAEQMRCLCNKLYCIGYLASRYKNPSKPFAVYAFDNLVAGAMEANGRSGKSLFFKYLQIMCSQVTINGRKRRLTENQFIYENVVKGTCHIRVEDISPKVDMDFFYTDIADNLYINRKGRASFCLDFEESPKFIFTSNYVPLDDNPSTQGRLLYCTFADWYHLGGGKQGYERTWSAYDEFGRNLPDRQEWPERYTQEDYDKDITFILTCIQFFQACSQAGIKVMPPLGNMELRRDTILMGERFVDWADMYFSVEGMLGELVDKQRAMAEFVQYSNSKPTSNSFTRSLKLWVKRKGYTYNGKSNPDEAERIIKRDVMTKCVREYIIINNQ